MILSLLKVSGHSMEPIYKMGSLVLVSNLPYKLSSPKLLDPVVFLKDQKYILKRITEIKDGKYLVVGDNKSDSKDFGWIEKNEILGKVILKF